MWRPPNWRNPWYDEVKDFEKDLFEAGADAILKALRRMAEESPTGTFTIDSRGVNVFENIEL